MVKRCCAKAVLLLTFVSFGAVWAQQRTPPPKQVPKEQPKQEKQAQSDTLEFIQGTLGPNGLIASFGDTKSKERVIEVELDPSSFGKNPHVRKPTEKPDYSKYHTVLHIVDIDKIRRVEDKAKITYYVVRVNVAGKDPKTGQQRRFALGGTPLSSATHDFVGAPGTRLTFEGAQDTALRIVPGIVLWRGAIDIDPTLGVLIEEGTQMQPSKR